MKIRKIFESMTDPDDMFEIFKDIVDDVLHTEFETEIDYEFKKGQIEITLDEIYLDPGDEVQEFCSEDNWVFQFKMPDKREVKARVKQRIADLFERKTGTKISLCELGMSDYNHVNSKIRVLASKKEWIDASVNLRDFEDVITEFEFLLPDKWQEVEVLSNFYFNKITNINLAFILSIGDGLGLLIELERPKYLHEIEKKDGQMSYKLRYVAVFYYRRTWMPLKEETHQVDVKESNTSIVQFIDRDKSKAIDEVLKNKLLLAQSELNQSESQFLINLLDDSDDNLQRLSDFISEKVLPKLQSNQSELIEQVEDQINKLLKEDNIEIDFEIISKYTKGDTGFIVWLCETDFKGGHFIFKFTLNLKSREISIHDNRDENNDGATILTSPVSELSDAIFLVLIDRKLVSQ